MAATGLQLRGHGRRSALATYFLRVSTFSRGKGSRITRLAAYRAGELIRDERTGETYNYSKRQDVAYKEIVLPSHLAASADMEWARNRPTLWNAAEHAGHQRNARLAREVLVILPHELTAAQRIDLVRHFSRELADKYQSAVDFSIHQPRPHSDERNHHAHVLMTTREVTAHGLGARNTLELSGTERRARGLGPSKADYFLIRERWAQVTNEALREAGIAAHIDHRSLKEQGIDRAPRSNIPRKVYYAELNSGSNTPAGDQIRARHRERVAAHLAGGDELVQVTQRQREEDRHRAIEWSKQTAVHPKEIPSGALTREQRRQRERERRSLNRETLNEKRRENYKENAAAILQKQRAWYQANAARISDRRREWYKANAEKVKQQARERWSKTREQRQLAVKSAQQSALPEQSALAIGQRTPPDPAKEAAKKKWLAFRKSQEKSPTAEDSVRNWLAFREHQKQTDPSQTTPQERSRDQRPGATANYNDEDDKDRKTDRSRDNDYGL